MKVEYNIPLTGCKVFYKGVEQKVCKPKDIILHLNALFVPSPGQKLYFGEECAIGEEVAFKDGFAIGPITEAKLIPVTATAITGGWTVTYGPTEWGLQGMNKAIRSVSPRDSSIWCEGEAMSCLPFALRFPNRIVYRAGVFLENTIEIWRTRN